MSEYPQYFCHGDKYYPPNTYYRVDGPSKSVLVLPIKGDEWAVNYPIEYFLKEREGRAVTPVTKEEIDVGLAKWIKHNRPAKPS